MIHPSLYYGIHLCVLKSLKNAGSSLFGHFFRPNTSVDREKDAIKLEESAMNL